VQDDLGHEVTSVVRLHHILVWCHSIPPVLNGVSSRVSSGHGDFDQPNSPKSRAARTTAGIFMARNIEFRDIAATENFVLFQSNKRIAAFCIIACRQALGGHFTLQAWVM
jgi:hypothetical protein